MNEIGRDPSGLRRTLWRRTGGAVLGMALLLGWPRPGIAAPIAVAPDKQEQVRKLQAVLVQCHKDLQQARQMLKDAKSEAERERWTQSISEIETKLRDTRAEMRKLASSRPSPSSQPDPPAPRGDPWAWLDENREELLKLHYPSPAADAGKGPWPIPVGAAGKSLADRMKEQKELQAIVRRHGELLNAVDTPQTAAEKGELWRKAARIRETVPPISLGELLSLVPLESRGEWKDFATWDQVKTRTGEIRRDGAVDVRFGKWCNENATYLVLESEGIILRAHNYSRTDWLMVTLQTVVVDGVAVPAKFTLNQPLEGRFKMGQRVRFRFCLTDRFHTVGVGDGDNNTKGLRYSPDDKTRVILVDGTVIGRMEVLDK